MVPRQPWSIGGLDCYFWYLPGPGPEPNRWLFTDRGTTVLQRPNGIKIHGKSRLSHRSGIHRVDWGTCVFFLYFIQFLALGYRALVTQGPLDVESLREVLHDQGAGVPPQPLPQPPEVADTDTFAIGMLKR